MKIHFHFIGGKVMRDYLKLVALSTGFIFRPEQSNMLETCLNELPPVPLADRFGLIWRTIFFRATFEPLSSKQQVKVFLKSTAAVFFVCWIFALNLSEHLLTHT